MNGQESQKDTWVVSCSECPEWRPDVCQTIDEALKIADTHDLEAHQGEIVAVIEKE